MKIIGTNKDQKKKTTAPKKEKRAPRAKPVKKWDITANLINNTCDAWIVTDLKFKVLNWNTAAEKMYGWKQHEILNQPLTKFINTEYLTGTNSETAFQQVLEHGHWQGEVIQNRKDGSRFTVMASVSLVKENDGKSVGFVAIHRDITEGKRVKEKLLLYEKIREETNDAVFLIDTQTSKYIDFNLVACKMLGYSHDELIQLGVIDIAQHITSMPYWHERVEMISENGLIFETNYQRKDKTIFPVEVSAKIMSDAEKEIMIAVVRDITRRKQDEGALQKSEQLYRLLAENSSDAVSLFGADHKALYISPAYGKLLGYTNEDMLNINHAEIVRTIHPEDHERIFQQLTYDRQHRLPYSQYAYRALTKQGGYIWLEDKLRREFDENGQIIQVIVNTRDVNKHKQDEAALQKSESLYRLLAENSSDAVSLFGANHEILYVSPAYGKLLGYANENLLNIGHTEIVQTIHPEDRERIFQQIIEGHQHRLPYSQYAYRALTKQGGYIWLEDILRREFDENGQMIQIIVNTRDVTKRKQDEEMLRKNEEQFRNLAENIPSFIYILDLTSNHVVYLNKETFLGYDHLELTQAGSILGQLHPEDAPRVMSQWQQVIQGGSSELVEYRLKSKTLDWEWVQSNSAIMSHTPDGKVKEMIIILTVITIRKQAEETLRRRNLQLKSQLKISIDMTSELDLNRLLETISTGACELLDTTGGGIYLLHTGSKKLILEIVVGEKQSARGTALEQGQGLAGKIWETGQPNVVDDYDTWPGRAPVYVDISFKAVCGVPIQRGGEFLGVLTVLAEPPRKFSKQDIALLETYAATAAVAIYNARLYQNVQHRLNQLEVLYTTSQTTSNKYDIELLLGSIVKNACKLLNAASSGIYLTTVNSDELEIFADTAPYITARVRLRFGEGAAGRVAQTRQPLRIDDYSIWEGRALIYDGLPIRAVLEVPMLYHGELVGVLTADENGTSTRKFTQEDEHLLSLFASQAAGAIHSARLYQQAEHRAREFAGLYETTRDLSSIQLDLPAVLTRITQRASELLSVDNSSISLYDAIRDDLELVARIGMGLPLGTRRQLGDGLSGRVAQSRAPIILKDSQKWEHQSTLYKDAPSLYSSAMGVPLLYAGGLMGTLIVAESASSARVFNEADQRLLSLFAGQAASAIYNAQLFNSLKNSNAELTQAYDATIEGWSHAMDLRDKETEGHTQRVSEMSLRLARAMRIPETEIVHIRRGALLHDIGKIGIPDNILLKKGALSPEEWAIMYKHPTYAYEMLSRIDYLKPSLIIPYCHHEKWDGTGYPRALKGEDIPLAARIFAFADVWDALRSDRPYRAGWSAEKVIEYIKLQVGSHFDPAIAEVFLALMAENND